MKLDDPLLEKRRIMSYFSCFQFCSELSLVMSIHNFLSFSNVSHVGLANELFAFPTIFKSQASPSLGLKSYSVMS